MIRMVGPRANVVVGAHRAEGLESEHHQDMLCPMPGNAEPKRGLRNGVCSRAVLVLYEGQGSLFVYGLRHSLSINEIIHYNYFLDYAFNIGGLIFRA